MSSPLINLSDDSIFNSSSSGRGARRGIQTPQDPATKPRVNLSDDSLFYKGKEEASQDTLSDRYRAMYGYDKQEEPVQPKRGITNVLSDLGTAVFEGAKNTGRAIGATSNTITGDLADVEGYSAAQRAAAPNSPQAKRDLLDEIERRKQADPDPSVVSAVRNVGSAMLDNPEGAAQFVAEQAPNTVVSLGAGVAGAKAGALAAPFLGPLAPAGPVVGFLGGMFLGNFALETGNKAMEKARDGFTEADRSEALQEGAVKGGVITAVDAVTLGAGGKLAKTLGKPAIEAGARAEARVLADAGVDMASRASIEKALADPAIRVAAKAAGQSAAKAASTTGSKAAAAGTGLALETVGEGAGEYLGELAATGKADVYDAVLEAAAGLTQSAPETAYNLRNAAGNDLDVKGIQRSGVQATPPESRGITPPGQDQGKPLDQEVDERISSEERPPMSWMEVNETLQSEPALMALLLQDATTPEQREMVERAIARSEVGDQVQQALADPELLERTRIGLNSDVGQSFIGDLQASLPMYANEMPPSGMFKVPSPDLQRQQQLDEMTASPEYQEQLAEEAERVRVEREASQMQVRKPVAADAPQDAQSAESGVDVASMTTPDGTVVPLDDGNRSGYEAYFAGRGAEINGLTNPAVRQSAMQNVMQEMTKVGFTPEESREILNREEPSAPVTGREGTFENLSQTMSREFGEPIENFRQTKAPKYFTRIGSLFGVNIVAYNYTGKNPAVRKKAGRYIAGTNGKGTVLLNLTTADSAALFVLGHEVYHDLERRFPQQAQQLALEIKSYLSSSAQQRYKQFYEGKNQAQKTDSEIAADVMGTMFTDRKFWEQLGQRNPSLLDRVLSVLSTIIDSFRANADSSRQQIGKEIAQFEKVRDMMAEFASQGVEQTAQARGRAQPAAAPAQVSDMDEMPGKAEDDVKALDRVMKLLKDGNLPAAARTFKEAGLYAKGFGSFTEIQRMATQPAQSAPVAEPAPTKEPAVKTLDGKRVDERRRFGDFVNRDGQVVRNPNAVQVARTDETPVTDDQEGMSFVSAPSQPKKKPAPAPVEARSEPREQMRLPFGPRPNTDTPAMTRLRNRLDGIIKNASSIKFFQDTIVGLEQQIADIESRIKSLDRIEVDGKVFRARNEEDEMPGLWGIYDMNAYDRFADGFIADKPTTKQELLAARRALSEELTKVRETSIAAKAALFRRSISRMADQMMNATRSAINGGMPEADARKVFNDYYQALSFRETKAQDLAEAMPDLPAADAQSDMFDGLRVAMGFVADFRNKQSTASELNGYLEQGLRDGDFSYQDVVDAFRSFKLDIPRGVMDVSSQLAIRKTLDAHLKEAGHSTASRMEWLVSMDKVLSVKPGARSDFTAEELALHDNVFAKRGELRSRRAVTEQTVAANDPDDAFPNLLFNNYTLAEATNDKTLNKWLQGNAREAWFQDVAFALRSRPDLAGQVLNSLGDDRAPFDAWVQQKKDAIAKEATILAKAPAFAELRNMDYAQTILTSQPVTASDINAGAEDTRPDDLERLYATVANSELNDLPSVLDAVAKVRSMLMAGIDMETGEIFQSQSAAEAAAAEYIDSVYMNAMMVEPPRSNIGARFEGDIGFGMTVEQAGERDIGLPQQTFDTDESLSDLISAGLVSETDVEGLLGEQQATDEEADVEAENAGEQTDIAAERADRSPRPVNVPTSLVGTDQYRFRKGFFNGNLVPAVVSEHLNKIASRWAGAPNMVIVPNVQSLPEELREKVMAKLGSNMFAKGLYYNGDVYVFTDHAESLADAEFTLFHEVQGHFGMRAFLGADFDAYLDRLYKTNPDIRRAADQRMAEDPMGPLEAVDEVLSDMQVDGGNQGMFQAYVGKVIAGLRKIGMERVANWIASQGNFEVAYLLRGAKDAVRRGDRPSIGAPDDMRLAATRTPYELFSAKDGKTVAYARYNPVLDRWSIFTANGQDIRKGFNTAIEADFEKVVTTMRKMGRVERRLRSGVYVDNKIPSDLAKIPDFRILSEDINFTSVEGLKTLGALIKRNGGIFFQNEYIPVFEVVNHLEHEGRISEAFDVRGDLEGLYERRTGAKLEKYRKQYEKPLMKLVEQLGKEGGNTTLAEAFPSLAASFKDSRLGNLNVIDAYLGARHAAERNKQIAKINPNQPDGGSGIFTADADLILNTLSRQSYGNTLSEMTHILQEISQLKLSEMYDSGMIGRDELKARSQYKYYVNLSGINENIDQFDNPVILAGGPKFGTRKDRRAMGRGDAASDILIRTLQSFEASVIHAEKNKVKQKVLAMLEINYDPDFVVINKQATVRKLDENGQVTEATDDRYIQNRDVMVVHVKGKPITMEFKQKGPGTFGEAINGMIWPPEATNWFQRFSGRANQLMGQMLTTWNPAWTAVNYIRDLQSLYFNAVTEGRITREMAKEMVKLQPQAIKAAFHVATDGKRGHSASQDMLDAYIEMRDSGGATSFLNLRGLENQVQELEKLMNPAKKGSAKDVLLKAADLIESINIPMEMAPRIAAFKVMRDNGYSAEEAARFAGDITVNFNMRGSSKFMRNMFLFFNPAVQGTNKMYRLAKENPKTMTKIALGMAAAGFITNIIARALGGEDDDGIDKLDKVPVFKRATSIVIWPDMPGAAIPIPYGWNAFYAAGHFMADTLWAGSQSASTTAKRIVGAAFESFSPLGGAMLDASSTGVGALKTVTPTVLSPLVDLILNENRFGAPISKEASMFGGGKRADSHMNFDSASPISTAAFRGLNKLTGGDKVNAGVIDINSGAFDYLVSGYLPGLAAETYKFASWTVRKAQGYDTKDAALPIIDRLTAKIPEGYNFGMLRRAETFIKTKVDDYEVNPGNREAILKEYPNLGAAKSIIGAVDYQVGQLRQARNQLEAADMPEEKKVEMYNLSRQREKEIVAKAVQLVLQTNPQMRKVLLAND